MTCPVMKLGWGRRGAKNTAKGGGAAGTEGSKEVSSKAGFLRRKLMTITSPMMASGILKHVLCAQHGQVLIRGCLKPTL